MLLNEPAVRHVVPLDDRCLRENGLDDSPQGDTGWGPHGNARLTPIQRRKSVLHIVCQGWSVVVAADACNDITKTSTQNGATASCSTARGGARWLIGRRHHPGELVHVDTKKLARNVRPGHRVTATALEPHRGLATRPCTPASTTPAPGLRGGLPDVLHRNRALIGILDFQNHQRFCCSLGHRPPGSACLLVDGNGVVTALGVIEHELAVARIAMGSQWLGAGCISLGRSAACLSIAWRQPSPVAGFANKSIALVGLGFMVPSAQQHQVLDLRWIAERVILHVVNLYRSRVKATGYLTSFISELKSSSNN